MAISNMIRSWLRLVPLIPSVIVAIFNLYHLLRCRTLRTALNNHVIILLLSACLFESLTDIVWNIYYLRNDTPVSSTRTFCFVWVFISSFGVVSIYILTAWASIERHILIFHSNWFTSKRNRFFFHYLPLAMCILWPSTFYFIFYYIVPCNFSFSYNKNQCGLYSCILIIRWASLCDALAHYIIPAFITVFFSVTLLARVMYHKNRIHQRIDWRNYKKMAIQLIPISALCFFLYFPPMILYAAYSVGLSRQIAADYYTDSVFFSAWIVLFTPFATVMSLPELRTKCAKLFLFWRTRRVVGPEQVFMTRLQLVRRTATAAVF